MVSDEWWFRQVNASLLIQTTGQRVSARKWRLFLAAAARDARSGQLVPAVVDAVSLAERYADGLIGVEKLRDAHRAVNRGWGDTDLAALLDPGLGDSWRSVAHAVRYLEVAHGDTGRAAMCLREVIGNPFRWVRWEDEWVTRTVHQLAAPAYAEGRFDGLPVLADALEDEGCGNPELLAHLRGPGPHARGCWALDVVLGKV